MSNRLDGLAMHGPITHDEHELPLLIRPQRRRRQHHRGRKRTGRDAAAPRLTRNNGVFVTLAGMRRDMCHPAVVLNTRLV